MTQKKIDDDLRREWTAKGQPVPMAGPATPKPEPEPEMTKQLAEEYLKDLYGHPPENVPPRPKGHYSTGGVEPWDLIHDAKLNFDEGNVVKYVCRHRRKDGLVDLKKAISYLRALAVDVYGEEI